MWIIKRLLFTAALALALVLTAAPEASAGTTFVGAKGWFTTWNSGILDWLEKDLAVSFSKNRLLFTVHRDPGDGYLAGPLLGYMTDNGKWSFSFAPMMYSNFDQSWSGSAGSMRLMGRAELQRKDYDFAASYTLSKHYKVYFGYKIQYMDLDFVLTYDTTMGSFVNFYSLECETHIPTIGLGAAYALSPKTALSGQAGLLYSLIDLTMSDTSGNKEDIWPQPGLGFNAEATATYKPTMNAFLQLGYRYQVFVIEARGPGREIKTKSYDITYGPTASVMWSF